MAQQQQKTPPPPPQQPTKQTTLDGKIILKKIVKSIGNQDQEITDVLVGQENEVIEHGNSIIQKGRIFDGDTNRLANLFDYYEMLGCNKTELDMMRSTIFGASLGFCREIPDYGMRGELIDLKRPKPEKKEPAPPTGIFNRGNNQPQPQQEATQ